jgi:hypothetical protein
VSLDRYTVSSRRLSVLVLGALALTAGGVALAASRPLPPPVAIAPTETASAEPTAPAATPSDEVVPATSAPPPAASAPPPVVAVPHGEVLAADGGPGGDGPANGQPARETLESVIDQEREAAEVVEAQQVAADFAAGYASYRYDDPPGAAADRVREHASPELVEALERETGGAAGREELAAREQTAEALVESIQTQTVADGWMDLLVVVRQTVSTISGSEVRWPSYLLRVERTDGGWRVSGFQP